MEKLKKIASHKYFYIILFGVLLLVFSLLLFLTVKHDVDRAKPQDSMQRITGTVTYVNSYTADDQDGGQTLHYDIGVHVETGNGSGNEDLFFYDVPATEVGRTIKLKYDPDTPGVFLIANEGNPHYRIVLYVLYSAMILICLSGMVMSSKVLKMLRQNKVIEQNRENAQRPVQTDAHGIDYNSTDAYQGYDGTETDLNPFAGSDMDYQSMAEYEQSLNDAHYSAEGTYTGYEPAGNPTDTPVNPADTYPGYEPAGNPTDAGGETPGTAEAAAPVTEQPVPPGQPTAAMPVPGYPAYAPFPPGGMYMGYPPMNGPYPPAGMYPGYPPMNAPYPPAGMYPGYPPMNMPFPQAPDGSVPPRAPESDGTDEPAP